MGQAIPSSLVHLVALVHVISASKADRLSRELLFERVYAVRVRAFSANYRRAEVDMHFSVRNDLTSLQEFLEQMGRRGLHGVTVLLTRGVI